MKVLYESLKKSNEVIKFVTQAVQYVNQAIIFANNVEKLESMPDDLKLSIGLFLREAS